MIAVDTNILVYAHRLDSPHNERAYAVLGELATGAAAWAIPWPCVFEFLAVVTHPKIYRADPTPPARAMAQVEAWRSTGNVALLGETEDSLTILRDLLAGGAARGPQLHDARVAAICLSHDVSELWTADRDLALFAALATRNPLAG